MARQLREVVFVDGVRTPFGKAKGQYAETRADDLVIKCIRELLRRWREGFTGVAIPGNPVVERTVRNNIRDLISQIDRAVSRIDDKSYGTCERCGRPIDAARLKALPHASLCLDCKRREERVR